MQKDSFVILIHQIHNSVEKENNNKLRSRDITFSQMNVLMTLADTEELSFKELEKKLSLAQSTTAGLISRLEKKKLIKVSGDSQDKRIKYVRITDLGLSYCREAQSEISSSEKVLLSSLTDSEKDTLISLMDKVKNTIK